jgi:hypothetical protein
MLAALSVLSCAKIVAVTEDSYNADISNPKSKNRVWAFLFYLPFCKKYREAYQAMEQASILTNGTIHYGMINCQASPRLCHFFGVDSYPTIFFRNRTSRLEFVGAFNPVLMVKQSQCLFSSSAVKLLDDSWLDDYRHKPTAVLFTKKQRVSPVFAALSRSFPRSRMRFAICNDESLFPEFNITDTPTVVFYGPNATVVHEGMRRIRFLKESARALLENRESRAPVHAEFFVNSELPEICYDYSVSCVFSYDNYVDPKVDDVRLHFRNDPFRFFVGTDPLPFPGIQVGDFVIFNAKKRGIIVVKDIAKLTAALDRVIDGGAKWSPLKAFRYDMEL